MSLLSCTGPGTLIGSTISSGLTCLRYPRKQNVRAISWHRLIDLIPSHLPGEPGLARCPLNFPYSLALRRFIHLWQTKSFHILLDTVRLYLPWTSSWCSSLTSVVVQHFLNVHLCWLTDCVCSCTQLFCVGKLQMWNWVEQKTVECKVMRLMLLHVY